MKWRLLLLLPLAAGPVACNEPGASDCLYTQTCVPEEPTDASTDGPADSGDAAPASDALADAAQAHD